MQVTVTGKQFDVGDSLRGHATATTTTIVERYFGKAIEAHVVLHRERHLVHAEITVHPSRGFSVQCAGAAADAYAAFDGAAERLDKRLRRHKRRLRSHHGPSKEEAAESADAIEELLAATSYVLAGGDDVAVSEDEPEAEAAGEPLIIAEMRTSIPEISVSEAVMQLDLSDAPALLFRNSAHGNLNMIYRRRDGNVGWIDPDFAEGAAKASRKAT